MKIKDGFNSLETEIRIVPSDNGSIQLWINQPGLADERTQETLSYMTAQELFELHQEVKRAARDLFDI